MNININRADIEEIGRVLSEVKNAVPRIISTAINRTIVNVRTDAVKRIGSKINLKAARIKKDFKDHKATYQNLKGSVEAVGDPVGLISFIGTKALANGKISYKIYKDGNRQYLNHAFIAKGKGNPRDPDNPKLHVFSRKQYRGKLYNPRINYGGLRRALGDEKLLALPLHRHVGPAIEDVFEKPEIFDPVMQNAAERLEVNIESRLDYELSKLK